MKVKVLRVKAEVSRVNGLKGQGRSQGSMVSRVKVESVKGQWSMVSRVICCKISGWLESRKSQGSRLKVSRVSGLKVKVESPHRQWSQESRLKVKVLRVKAEVSIVNGLKGQG